MLDTSSGTSRKRVSLYHFKRLKIVHEQSFILTQGSEIQSCVLQGVKFHIAYLKSFLYTICNFNG